MNVMKEVFLSFYSRDFYAKLARGRGIGMRFICILTLLTAVFLGGFLLWLDQHYHDVIERVPEWANTLPAVTYKEGKISIDKPVPYYIQLGKTGQALWVVIDTNYSPANPDALEQFMRQNKVMLLVTANKFIMLKDSAREHGIDIRDIDAKQDFIITHADWKKCADMFATYGIPIFIVITVVLFAIGMFVSNLIATFFNALVVLLLGLIMSASLDFAAAMRIAAAYRIPIAFFSSPPIMGIVAPHQTAFAWLVWLGYLIFSVHAAKPRGLQPVA